MHSPLLLVGPLRQLHHSHCSEIIPAGIQTRKWWKACMVKGCRLPQRLRYRYYQAYLALPFRKRERFSPLKEMMERYWAAFPSDEAHDIYLLTINLYPAPQSGRVPYIREAFELYRTGLERKLLLREGELSKFTYNNVLMLAIAWRNGEEDTFWKPIKLPARSRARKISTDTITGHLLFQQTGLLPRHGIAATGYLPRCGITSMPAACCCASTTNLGSMTL